MLKEKMTFEKKKAVLFTCDFTGPVEGYALAYLTLINNAREYDDSILKVWNNSGSTVFVIASLKARDAARNWLNEFYRYIDRDNKIHVIGKIESEEEIEIGVPVYLYESTYKFDDPRWEEDMDKSISYWVATECEVQ